MNDYSNYLTKFEKLKILIKKSVLLYRKRTKKVHLNIFVSVESPGGVGLKHFNLTRPETRHVKSVIFIIFYFFAKKSRKLTFFSMNF
jgi:hypothetical protein